MDDLEKARDVANTREVSVADLVNQLFETHRHPSGREFMNKEVERTLRGEITQAYLSKLRRGIITDPGRNHLLLICQFFGVPASYFFPELRANASEIHVEDDVGRLHATLRSLGLNDEARRYLVGLATILRDNGTS